MSSGALKLSTVVDGVPTDRDATKVVGGVLPLVPLTINGETKPVGPHIDDRARKGANTDITDLLGINGAGVRLRASSTALASAATVDLGAAPTLRVAISGVSTITSFGTVPNALVFVRFAGALTLTHNATSLILPGGVNIVTAVGDTAIAVSDASGNWRVFGYQRASGKPVASLVASDITDGVVSSIRRRGRPLTGVVTSTPLDASLVTPTMDALFQPGYVPPSGAFGRASTAFYHASSGLLVSAASGELRFEADATTGENLGALIQDLRTNFFLQSGAPATQTISLAAGTYCLWVVEGTGSLTLSAGATGTATPGSPASFTLGSTTSVTVTASGTLAKAQLENGSFPTSYIATTTAAVTRAADVFQWTLPANWWNPNEGTFFVDAVSPPGIDASQQAFEIGDGTTANRVLVYRDSGRNILVQSMIGGVVSGVTGGGQTWPDNTRRRIAFAIRGGTMAVSIDGGALRTASATVPPASILRIGDRAVGGRAWNGGITQFGYIPRAVANTVLPLMSA